MSDNIIINPGSGGATIATDDIGGVAYQRIKVQHGADGSATDVSTASPLPVTLANTGANSTAVKVDNSAVTQPVSGTITANAGSGTLAVSAASLPLPSGAATSAKQDTGNTSLSSIDGKITAVNTGAVVVASGSITADTELTTADLDTGAGTDTRAVVGLVGSKSGGAVLIPGDSTKGLAVDLSATGANTNKLLVTPDLPSGAATATKQDTGNTSLSSIDGKITAVNTGAVVVSSSALPSGAATSAKQPALGTAGTASVDVLTVQGKASMTPLLTDGSATTQPISGTVTATVTGVATATNQTGGSQKTQVVDGSGNVIGATSNALDVNIKSGASSGTQYTEDAAAATDPVGTAVNLVRKDTPAATVSADGDNIAQRGTNYGAAYVTLLDASGNAVTVGGGTQYAEDSASADGEQVTMAGVVRKDTRAAISGTDGDRTELQVNASGDLRVDGSAVTQPVSGTVTANAGTGSFTVAQATGSNLHTVLDSGTLTTLTTLTGTTSLTPGTAAANLGKAEDAPHASGDVGVMALAVRNDAGAVLAGTDGDYHALTTDATGALRVDLNGTVSTVNSSTATLLAAAVFTGTSEDAINYNEIRVSVIASHASATDGLSIQQSSDGTNWDISDTYTIPAATGKVFALPRQARYVRVVYTNGGTNQSSFRLSTIFNRVATMSSSQRAGDGYTNETDLEQTQDFNMLYNGTTWDRVRGDITNGLDVDVTRLPALVAGAAIVGKVGIDQTTPGTTNLVALAANQSVNVAQINGVTALMGNGVTGTGSQRVTVASDNTPFPIKLDQTTPGTTNATSLAQIGANTVSTGVGASGTGTQRVVTATDSTIGTVTTVTTLTGTTTLTPGTAATNLGKAEDAAHTTGDTGVFALAVRNDGAATAFSNANGDYTPIAVDSAGTVSVVQKTGTATLTNVASSATNVTLLAANTARKGATLYNDSTQVCYVKFGATASSTSFTVPLATNTYYEVPGGYTGILDGIWVSANGNMRVTELT